MAAGRRKKGGGGGHEGPDERWLLTYADMITLLMALFIVMWSISSVNISKFDQLKASLKSAFSGKVGRAVTSRRREIDDAKLVRVSRRLVSAASGILALAACARIAGLESSDAPTSPTGSEGGTT